MTTINDRPGTALVIVDVQVGVVADAHDREAVIANIQALVERARTEKKPIVWVQHVDDERLRNGGDAWRIVPELTPIEGEPLIQKRYGDAFEETTLEGVLADLGIGRIIVAGAQTDACIRSTLHGAFVRGYDVTLIGDAHTTEDLSEYGAPTPDKVIAHTNLYWQHQSAPGRTAETVLTRAVSFNR